VINQERDKSNCGEQNNRENSCNRPEDPRPRFSFSDVLNGVVQRECRSDRANRSKKEGGHKSVTLRPTASMLETVNGRKQNRQEVKACDEIRNCQAEFAYDSHFILVGVQIVTRRG